MSFYIAIYLETPRDTDLDLNQENLKTNFRVAWDPQGSFLKGGTAGR